MEADVRSAVARSHLAPLPPEVLAELLRGAVRERTPAGALTHRQGEPAPRDRMVRVQAGVLLGELDRATQPFGLAVPAGIVTHTGVAGLTLGGGLGWLTRTYGLTVDQLLSVDLVTATGEVVRASEDNNADLFWGVRGGGGNFGIVTEFRFWLQPVGPRSTAAARVSPSTSPGSPTPPTVSTGSGSGSGTSGRRWRRTTPACT